MDTGETPRSGFHRLKRDVDRLWMNEQLRRLNLTVAGFGKVLAAEMRRALPFDKSSMSRRLEGRIPFTAKEAEALSKIFDAPLAEVLRRVGSSIDAAPLEVGSVTADGDVETRLDAGRAQTYQLRLTAEDGWSDALLTVRRQAVAQASATRGLYIVTRGDHVRLRQFLGMHGKALLLAAPFDASQPIASIDQADVTRMCRVVRIDL